MTKFAHLLFCLTFLAVWGCWFYDVLGVFRELTEWLFLAL